MTKFPDSVSFVFVNLRVNYSAVRLALVNLIACIENSSVVTEAICVLRKINSWVFCADIYSVYSIFSNICQEVNLLPHKTLDQVQDVTKIFLKTKKALYHWDYAKKCLWSSYYADLLKMEIQRTFMGFEVEFTNIGTLRQTKLHSADARLSVADGIAIVRERLSNLTWRFNKDLSREVFDDSTKEVMERCRVICGLKFLLVEIYQKGSVMARLEEAKTFLNAVRSITEYLLNPPKKLILRY